VLTQEAIDTLAAVMRDGRAPATARISAAVSLSDLGHGSPMHAYAWYIWWKTPRSGPSLKIRLGRDETDAVPGEVAGRTPAPLVAAADFRGPAVARV
jgi:hypothetical protein